MTNEVDILKFSADELTKDIISNLIREKRSFQIENIKDQDFVVANIEREIEHQGLRCRVYTENRSAVLMGAAIPTLFTQVAAATTAIGIGLHNLATLNPDYEIAKGMITATLSVNYKKA